MKVGFIRYHGQDSATVFVGDAQEAIRRDLNDPTANVAELQAAGFLTIVEQDIPSEGTATIAVGHLI